MELHPTPESWRIALFTALGAVGIGIAGVAFTVVFRSSTALIATGILIAIAATATLLPAVGALTASVDADARGVTVRRFGLATYYAWADVTGVHLVERRANVPDGTEYHWVVPSRSKHVVAVPCLELADGRVREIPALAAPAYGVRRAAAIQQAERLLHLQGLTHAPRDQHITRAG
jgi:hypothetical protein